MEPTTVFQLTCRICGEYRDNLGNHVQRQHGITARDYKRRYGMNLNRPLLNPELSRRKSEKAKADLESIKRLKEIAVETCYKPGSKGRTADMVQDECREVLSDRMGGLTKERRSGRKPLPADMKLSPEEAKRRNSVATNNWRRNNLQHAAEMAAKFRAEHPGYYSKAGKEARRLKREFEAAKKS
jgi:hypothetical protein